LKPYYEADGVTIYHGDCREILPQLGDESADLILTDPPYGHNNNNGDLAHNREHALGLVKKGKARAGEARPIANDGPEANDLVRWMFGEAKRLLKPGAVICCCCGGGGPNPQFARWSMWLDGAVGFKHMVIWDKGGLGMGWHYRRNYETVLIGEKPGAACKWYGGNSQGNVIRISGIKPQATDHPTPKPEPLMAIFIRLHTLPGELVVDPFMGGGTTLLAAKNEGRRAIGVEVDERWCELAARRLSQGALFGVST
jgi:site-specific DNA-methyltransferase (adenine-specific)